MERARDSWSGGLPLLFYLLTLLRAARNKKRTLHACATSISHALEEGSGCIDMDVQYKTLGSKASYGPFGVGQSNCLEE